MLVARSVFVRCRPDVLPVSASATDQLIEQVGHHATAMTEARPTRYG